MSTRTAPFTTLLIGTLATTGLTAVARAHPLPEPRSVTVRFEDLNTNNTHSAGILYRRIKTAAEDVCGDLAPGRSLALVARYANCVQGAIGMAVAKVNWPRLTEYAMARGATPADAPIKVKVARND